MNGHFSESKKKEGGAMRRSALKQLLVCFMAMVLAVGMIPVSAFAGDGASSAERQQAQASQQIEGADSTDVGEQQADAERHNASTNEPNDASDGDRQQAKDDDCSGDVDAAATDQNNAAGGNSSSSNVESGTQTSGNGGTYSVATNDELADALDRMAEDGSPELTLVLKGGETFSVPTKRYVSTFGIDGKKITVTSDGD